MRPFRGDQPQPLSVTTTICAKCNSIAAAYRILLTTDVHSNHNIGVHNNYGTRSGDSTAVRNKDTDTHRPEVGKHMRAGGVRRQKVVHNTHTLARRR
jgi:hypothetical protein